MTKTNNHDEHDIWLFRFGFIVLVLRAESSSFFEGATSLLRIFFLALLIIAIVGLKITA